MIRRTNPCFRRPAWQNLLDGAISIRQPYVELIFRGSKKFEYRSKPISIFGPVYVYAALKPADDPPAWRKAKAEPGDFPTGAIVGSVEIVGCKWDNRMDCYAYELKNPKQFDVYLKAVNQPMPCFWRPRFSGSRKK